MKIVSCDYYPKPGDLGHPETIRQMAREGHINPFSLEPGILIRLDDNGTLCATKTNISQMLAYKQNAI